MLSFIANAVGDGLSLGDYMRLRAVCTAWRSALAPPFPALLRLTDGGRRPPVRATVFFLPLRRSFHYIYMGSSTALDDCLYDNLIHSHASIVGSGSGRLAIAIHSQADISVSSQVVFAPNPPHGRPKDWPTVVALYGRNKVAYIDATRSKEWTTIDVPFKEVPLEQLVDLAFDAGGQNVYCVDRSGGVRYYASPIIAARRDPVVVVQPAPGPNMASDGLAPPYDVAVLRNPTKHLFLCDGSLYHVWQAERKHRDEIFMLRFLPGRRPSWDVVKDLGGCSAGDGARSGHSHLRALLR
ncbi:hypothetical protein ACQ4PT_017517 [Festuca glaucescens]